VYDLRDFGLSEMMLVGAALRGAGKGSASLEQASQRVARYFVEEFVDGATGRSSFVLARCYKTHPFAGLPADLQQFARGVFPDQPLEPRTQCLTLLGSFGDDPAWQSRRGSSGHQTIPLTSERTVESLPMVARLTQAMGLAASELIRPDPSFLLEKDRQGFNVFHIEEALGSPYIPAQETFVRPNGVRSVIGFGVLVPPTHVYTTILFSRQHISAPTADLFKTLALSLKLALLPISTGPVFDHVES
jgi:hypothetical protein